MTVKDPQFFIPTGTLTVEPLTLTEQVIGQPALLLTVQVAPGQGGEILPIQVELAFTVSAPTISKSSQQTAQSILNVLLSLQLPSADETITVTSAPSLLAGAMYLAPTAC